MTLDKAEAARLLYDQFKSDEDLMIHQPDDDQEYLDAEMMDEGGVVVAFQIRFEEA